jgi:hypothetical protein
MTSIDATPTIDLTADAVATQLEGTLPEIPAGCVSFKGYLGAEKGGMHRLYVDDSFWVWWEIKATDIKARHKTTANTWDARSVVWVTRDAAVARCQAGEAHELHREDLQPDLASGPLPPRRPPYG